MLLLIGTIKPKSLKAGDWSYYCRLRLEETAGVGRWSLIGGPFFPFSKDAPEARSGDWEYRAGTLFFWADGGDPMQFVMTFDQIHALKVPHRWGPPCCRKGDWGPWPSRKSLRFSAPKG
jgi:hypothetical protein